MCGWAVCARWLMCSLLLKTTRLTNAVTRAVQEGWSPEGIVRVRVDSQWHWRSKWRLCRRFKKSILRCIVYFVAIETNVSVLVSNSMITAMSISRVTGWRGRRWPAHSWDELTLCLRIEVRYTVNQSYAVGYVHKTFVLISVLKKQWVSNTVLKESQDIVTHRQRNTVSVRWAGRWNGTVGFFHVNFDFVDGSVGYVHILNWDDPD